MPQSVSERSFVLGFHLIPRGETHQNRHFSAFGRTFPLNKNKSPVSIQVIGQVTKPYLGHCPYEADAAHDHVICSLRLHSENMFNPRANLRSCPVSLQLPLRKFLIARAFALQVFTIPIFMQLINTILRSIGRICPHITAGIARIQQLVKHIAVMHFGAGHMKTPDQLVFHIHRICFL